MQKSPSLSNTITTLLGMAILVILVKLPIQVITLLTWALALVTCCCMVAGALPRSSSIASLYCLYYPVWHNLGQTCQPGQTLLTWAVVLVTCCRMVADALPRYTSVFSP
jgi:hypothetical protein